MVSMTTSKKNPVRNMIAPLLAVLFLPLCLFPVAGNWGWWQGWVFIAVNIGMSVLSRGLMAIKNPDLVKERATFTASAGIKSWDKKLVPLVVYLPLLVMIVAALNQRYGWQPAIPFWLQMLGLGGMVLGLVLNTWAMVVNRFFSSVVRIQTERGHSVVSDGPYQIVRHPGYAGSLLANLCFPFQLGSLWAQIPMVLVFLIMILRTKLEDQTLQAELTGYKEYASHVRYRLFPGIW
jgi:protein-S-isoprenylcysteine O-methyltransferase Ste14